MDNIRDVTAFVYRAGEDVVYAASAGRDFLIPRDITRVALDVGVWVKVVLDDQLSVTTALQPDPSNCLNGEIRKFGEERTFMVHDIGLAHYQTDNLWVCETKSYGHVFFADHIVPLGLPDRIWVLLRRTTEHEERLLNGREPVSSRWMIEEVLSSDSTSGSESEESLLCQETEKMTVKGGPIAGVAVAPCSQVASPSTPKEDDMRVGIITGMKPHFRPPNFNRLAYVWTSGVVPGVEFQLLLQKGSGFLDRGDFIRFPITRRHFETARTDGYTFYTFERTEASYEIRAVRNTIEVFVPNVPIPSTLHKNKSYLNHHFFGDIWDRDRMLMPGSTMNIMFVRERPKNGACWRITQGVLISHSRPSTPPVTKPSLLSSSVPSAHDSSQCSTYDSPVRGGNTPDKRSEKSSGNSASLSSDAWYRMSGHNDVQPKDTCSETAHAPPQPVPQVYPQQLSSVPQFLPQQTVPLAPPPYPQMQPPASPSHRPVVLANVNVVTLKQEVPQHQQADEVRSEVGIVVDKTNQKDVYAVWLTNSHVEGYLHHKGPLCIGASFLGNFSFARNNVQYIEYIEEVPNIVQGQLGSDEKIELFVELAYVEIDSTNNHAIFWNDRLGSVRDIAGITGHADQTVSAVARRFRVSQLQGYVWCIAKMRPRADLPPPPPPSMSQDRALEVLDAFGDFYNVERIRQIISSVSPQDLGALEKYYGGSGPNL